MIVKRWYDDDDSLRMIIEALELFEADIQSEIALEIIQLMIEKQGNTDNFIHEFNKDAVYSGNRWYDRNDLIQSAVEMLRHIPSEQKTELYEELFLIIMNYKEQKLIERFDTE